MVGWDDDTITKLKKYYADGLTFSQIAANLKGFSRNAIIGKIHRLHLKPRGKPVSVKQLTTKQKPVRRGLSGAALLRSKESKPLPPPPVEPVEPIKRERIRLGKEFNNDEFFANWITGLKPPLRDIFKIPKDRECKWIKGEVRDLNAKWCRKPTLGLSCWCEYHYKLVYLPPVVRGMK